VVQSNLKTKMDVNWLEGLIESSGLGGMDIVDILVRFKRGFKKEYKLIKMMHLTT